MDGPRQKLMHQKLTTRLNPLHLELVNESYKHNVPPGSETHFKVCILYLFQLNRKKVVAVSAEFEGLSLIQQHRLVQSVLEEDLATGVHALAIKTLTPAKWEVSPENASLTTPNCMGGSKK